jgi:transposase
MSKQDDPKAEALQQQRCLNPRAEKVTSELFQKSDFFDPRDLLQVKYEMLRGVRVGRQPIRQAALRFGFSRPSVYKALATFDRTGLLGLVRTKPGPRRAHKLSESVLKFIEEQKREDGAVTLDDLVERVKRQFGLVVHIRSIQRALKRKEKKRL